jgi:hypothetical protein
MLPVREGAVSDRPFSDVYQGFLGDPGMILLVLLGLLAMVIGALAVFVVQNRRTRQARELQSERAKEQALSKLKLSDRERAILDRLVGMVSDPATRGHLVLTSQSVFSHCTSRLIAARGATDAEVAALRVRLGFARGSTEKKVTSTAILPPGLRLLVVQRETKKFYATVSGAAAAGLVAHIEDADVIAPGPGTELRCLFNVRSGTFQFDTVVSGVDGQTLRMAHSEKITRMQRRKYYRARTNLPARIGVAGSQEQPALTRLIDLSGGGASLENPAVRFHTGDEVQIRFSAFDGKEYNLVAEVGRVSHGGRVLHVVFSPMTDTARDRLIAFVLSLRKRGLAPPLPVEPGRSAPA